MESKIKSQKMKDIYKNTIQDKVIKNMDDVYISSLKEFISIFIYGGEVNECVKYFRSCVDWKTNKDWIKDYYEKPLEFNEDIIEVKNNIKFIKSCETKEEEEERYKIIIKLFKSSHSQIPFERSKLTFMGLLVCNIINLGRIGHGVIAQGLQGVHLLGHAHRPNLGSDVGAGQSLQGLVARDEWQAARPVGAPVHGYALVSCVVVPGFDFAGFTLAAPDWEPGA
jgi:hypothetical protein